MRADRGVPLEYWEERRQPAVASWVMRAFVGVVAALAAFAVGPVTAPARADDSANVAKYLDELHLNGFNGDSAEKDLRLGRAVCGQLDSRIEPLTIAIHIMNGSQIELKPAYDFVRIAARNLCPWHETA